MRNAFLHGLTELAQRDERVVLLTGDLGFKIFDEFAARFPGRFLNAGVAEANMASMAAGLAMAGLRPYIYSIVPFTTMRCFEQIRDDICYNHVPVTVVGVGGGYSYGHNGPTHHALEDIALMRLLPHMTVVCPGDPVEVELAVRASVGHEGPMYLRLGRAGDPVVHETPPAFAIGRAIPVRPGTDGTIISTGGMLPVALEAAEQLGASGLSLGVVSMHTVKPIDQDMIGDCFADGRVVFTLEEHYKAGGLGSAIAELLAGEARTGQLHQLHLLAVEDGFAPRTGDQRYLRFQHGLTAEQVAQRIMNTLVGVR